MHFIPSAHRLLLSGTPIQNNLQELWAVMDWTTSRTLLGGRTAFKELFISPILEGQVRNTSGFYRSVIHGVVLCEVGYTRDKRTEERE